MKNLAAIRYKNRLDNLFKKTSNIGDIEMQAHWARYLCILVSGFLDVAVPAILDDYTRARSSTNVHDFVSRRLDFRPLKMEGILQLTYSFSRVWGEKLELDTQGEIKDSINSIFGNRNQLAHGNDTGISYQRISLWYKDAVKLIDQLEAICDT